MEDIAIKVENISKKYRIGRRERYKALRDTLTDGLMLPVRSISSIFNPRQKHGAEESGYIWALKNVSFEVKRGDVLGIIGRNGAGKTTLLKVLSRITEPTQGYAEIRGRVRSLLEVGTGFHPELTGRENIYLNGAILGMKKFEIDKNFDDIVSFAEVEKFLDTPVKHYSSGMYVRLAFAVAAHLQPEILLIDEVLAVGDIEFQKKCVSRMEKVAGEGKTVLLVSHSMGSIKAICSKAMLIDKGEIKTIGAVDSVVSEYLSSYKADSAEKEIFDEDYVSGSKLIKINRVKILESANDLFSVYWKQPISVSLEVDVSERLSEVSFGAGIKMIDGTWVSFAHHDDYGKMPRWDFEQGKYTINFTLCNDLKPGIYKLCIGAHHKIYTKNLFHIESINLEVLDHTDEGVTPLVYNPGHINTVITSAEVIPLKT